MDQSALNHAFFVYATPMQWADKEKSIASVDRLIESLKKNPALMLQDDKGRRGDALRPACHDVD